MAFTAFCLFLPEMNYRGPGPMGPESNIAGHRLCAEVCRACMLMSAYRDGGVSRSNHKPQRGGARMGFGPAVTVVLLPFGGYGLARAGVTHEGASIVLCLLSMIAGSVLLPALCEERASFRHSSSHLTGRTLSGERSVDLNRITSVRLLTTFSYGSA